MDSQTLNNLQWPGDNIGPGLQDNIERREQSSQGHSAPQMTIAAMTNPANYSGPDWFLSEEYPENIEWPSNDVFMEPVNSTSNEEYEKTIQSRGQENLDAQGLQDQIDALQKR